MKVKYKQTYIEFAKKLLLARKASGLNQLQLSLLVGIEQRTISNYETGYTYPRPKSLIALAKALNVSIEDLQTNEVNKDIKKLRSKNIDSTNLLKRLEKIEKTSISLSEFSLEDLIKEINHRGFNITFNLSKEFQNE